ncbi:MAG: prepilin-type N-terminal cleavage/methylation domain-containing protein [Nitrospirota bacterium]
MVLVKNKRGVTLLELMVVLAIIGVMTAIAVPYYYGMLPHLRVKGASRDIAEAFQIARMKAIAKNTTYIVQFDYNNGSPANSFTMGPEIGSTGTFATEVDSGLPWLRNSSTYGWTGVQLYSDWLNAPEVFTGGKVMFYSDGTASVDGNGILGDHQGAVYLGRLPQSSSPECYRVLVNELTGMAKIQYINGTLWVDE